MLVAQNLEYAYPNSTPLQFPSFECKEGEQWLLLGQSGSGKTTLLNLIAGIRTPSSGTVNINGSLINQLSPSRLDRFRGKNIGIVFQQSHFVQSISIKENLMLAQKLAGKKADPTRIEQTLEQLNIGDKLHSKPSELSVGEQQRASIGRAIIHQPALILADEPTSALDDKNTEQVIQLLIEQAAAANAILLIVTHDNRLKSVFSNQISL